MNKNVKYPMSLQTSIELTTSIELHEIDVDKYNNIIHCHIYHPIYSVIDFNKIYMFKNLKTLDITAFNKTIDENIFALKNLTYITIRNSKNNYVKKDNQIMLFRPVENNDIFDDIYIIKISTMSNIKYICNNLPNHIEELYFYSYLNVALTNLPPSLINIYIHKKDVTNLKIPFGTRVSYL